MTGVGGGAFGAQAATLSTQSDASSRATYFFMADPRPELTMEKIYRRLWGIH